MPYEAQAEAFHAEHAARVKVLEGRLFRVDNADAAGRAAVASESELASMLDYAALSGNQDLAKAAFTAAHSRGAGQLLDQYFREIDPAERGPYREYSERLPRDVLERQRDVERVVQRPDPSSLMPGFLG